MVAFDDLPEFANDANRALHQQLKDHEKALIVVETELAETKERIGTMEEHLKSVNTEQLHTQRLVDAKIKEIETEDHLKQLAERGESVGGDTCIRIARQMQRCQHLSCAAATAWSGRARSLPVRV